MSGLARVKVRGADDVQRALDAAGAGLPQMQRGVLAAVLGEVVDYARPHMPSKTGRARASVKSRVTDRGGTVTLGGTKAPWAPWLDFGGQGKRRGRPAHRPFLPQGRYVYKALAVRQADINDVMRDGLAALVEQAGLDVT